MCDEKEDMGGPIPEREDLSVVVTPSDGEPLFRGWYMHETVGRCIVNIWLFASPETRAKYLRRNHFFRWFGLHWSPHLVNERSAEVEFRVSLFNPLGLYFKRRRIRE